jgi:hypothetical protein
VIVIVVVAVVVVAVRAAVDVPATVATATEQGRSTHAAQHAATGVVNVCDPGSVGFVAHIQVLKKEVPMTRVVAHE